MVSLLDKRLRSTWTSWTLPHSINETAIESFIIAFSSLDKLTKVRFLIALIGLDSARRKDLSGAIKRLLTVAGENTDEWVPVVASLVSRRLFACELSRLDVYSESLLGAARQIRKDPVHQKESCHLLPFQDKFLTITQGNRHKHDNISGYYQNLAQLPNFIEREAQVCARLSNKLESSTSLSNVSNVSRSSDISRGVVFQPIPQVLAASSRSLAQKTESNKAPIVIPISEIRSMEFMRDQGVGIQTNLKRGLVDTENVQKKIKINHQSLPHPNVDDLSSTNNERERLDSTVRIGDQVASLQNSGPDLASLFRESPLLNENDRSEIEAFFRLNWKDHFTHPESVLKFKLREDRKNLADGSNVLETFFLKLQCSDHSWSKTRKTTKIQN